MAVAPAADPATGIPESPATLNRFRHTVASLLRSGAILALLLMVAGLGLAYATGGSVLSPGSLAGRSVAGALRSGGPSALILAGLIVLVLTPVARVGASFAMFTMARDRPFMAITALVLVLLAGTVLVGVL